MLDGNLENYKVNSTDVSCYQISKEQNVTNNVEGLKNNLNDFVSANEIYKNSSTVKSKTIKSQENAEFFNNTKDEILPKISKYLLNGSKSNEPDKNKEEDKILNEYGFRTAMEISKDILTVNSKESSNNDDEKIVSECGFRIAAEMRKDFISTLSSIDSVIDDSDAKKRKVILLDFDDKELKRKKLEEGISNLVKNSKQSNEQKFTDDFNKRRKNNPIHDGESLKEDENNTSKSETINKKSDDTLDPDKKNLVIDKAEIIKSTSSTSTSSFVERKNSASANEFSEKLRVRKSIFIDAENKVKAEIKPIYKTKSTREIVNMIKTELNRYYKTDEIPDKESYSKIAKHIHKSLEAFTAYGGFKILVSFYL